MGPRGLVGPSGPVRAGCAFHSATGSPTARVRGPLWRVRAALDSMQRLGRVLRAYYARYKLPLLVTESGIADGDRQDDRRVRYLSGSGLEAGAARA